MKKKARFYILVAMGIFLTMVLIDSFGVFDDRLYNEVPHGSHTHYVPKNCDPPLAVSDSPTRRPAETEHIDCTGQYVPN
ncbi:MAG: hypothetical protein O3B41_03360 [Bacteroidetes bacterium]|nr:hypothetical protein [Bacteroidota bacterium]